MIFGTTVRNKRHGAEDGSGQDWMGGYTRWPEAYLVTLADRCFFLCVSGQRGTIAKSMHEEHLCVVALTRPLHGILTGSPMVVTLGQEYYVGEKPIVILYTYYINRHAEAPSIKQETL